MAVLIDVDHLWLGRRRKRRLVADDRHLQVELSFIVAKFRGDHEEDREHQDDVDHRRHIQHGIFVGVCLERHRAAEEQGAGSRGPGDEEQTKKRYAAVLRHGAGGFGGFLDGFGGDQADDVLAQSRRFAR